MSDQFPSTELKDHAAAFREVADKIDLNRTNGFGGAFVVVTPDGDVHTLLLLDNAANSGMFWGLVTSRADIALKELEDRDRQGNFGGRR